MNFLVYILTKIILISRQKNKQDIETKKLAMDKYYLVPLVTKDEQIQNDILDSMSLVEKMLFNSKQITEEIQIEFISIVLNKLIQAIREEILDDIPDDTSYDNIRGIEYAEYIISLMDTISRYGNSFLLKISENESFRFLTTGNLRVICYVVEKRWLQFWRLQDGVESLWEYLRFPQKLTEKIKQ